MNAAQIPFRLMKDVVVFPLDNQSPLRHILNSKNHYLFPSLIPWYWISRHASAVNRKSRRAQINPSPKGIAIRLSYDRFWKETRREVRHEDINQTIDD